MTSGSPQLRRRLSLSCVRSYSAACCSPFSRISAARFLWMEYYCRFFLCQRAAPSAQAPEIHKRLRLLMIRLFISCLQSWFSISVVYIRTSARVLPLFVSARNNIETLYQISLVKAFFLLYNTDTGEPRMQHPWRQREHPFFSDLIALILCFPNAQIHGCGPLRASICSMSSLSHGRFPLCLLCSFLRRSCPRTGAALFCLFGSTDGSARLSFSTQSFYVTCFFLC